MTATMVNVGLIQANIMPGGADVNLDRYRTMLQTSVDEPVHLLVFPEMFAVGFSAHLEEDAEQANGKCVCFLHEIAQTYQADAVASLPVREGGRIFNRLVWMSPERIRGKYDKRHLFFGTEQRVCTPGTQRTVIEALGQRWMPLVCYDIRFPLWSRNRFVGGHFDYDCLVYIANFPAPREQQLISLACARAIENQSYAIVVNRVGLDGENHTHHGCSAVISPQGFLLCQARKDEEQVLFFSLDFEKLKCFRKDFAVYRQWDDYKLLI